MPDNSVWNVPNQLSALRIVLAIATFIAIGAGSYIVALVMFLVASVTDFVDGWWARRFNQITQLGRILDPFADKLLVCGVLIMLAAVPESLIPAWAVVVIVGRELLVTMLRSLCEGRAIDFSAQWAGKWKMVFQCVVIGMSLWRLIVGSDSQNQLFKQWFDWGLIASLWIAVLSTLYSGWGYVTLAARLLRDEKTDS